jgi:hypothetical protein
MIPSSDCRLWPSDQSGPTPEIVVVSPRQLHLPQGHDPGAVAFSRTGDTTTGEFEDAVILAQFGDMDLTALSV